MKRRTLLAASAVTPLVAIGRARAQSGKLQVVWWHSMSGANGDEVNRLAKAFNDSQSEAEVQAIFKGGYADTLTAAIAAWRADQAPHLVQIFEVGTGSMLASGPATKQVWKLAEETGVYARSGHLYSRRPRLLQFAGRAHSFQAVQFVDGRDVVQQRRVRRRRHGSREGTGDVA